MKHLASTLSFYPFKDLETILEEKLEDASSSMTIEGSNIDKHEINDPEREKILFKKAMEDVVPLGRDNKVRQKNSAIFTEDRDSDEESEAIASLKELVERGKGFVVAHTPEYVEGSSFGRNSEIAKRLHRGDFSIQAHIDLHGLTVIEARDALSTFIMESINAGKRAVLIIHGRGLSSPVKPILKKKVIEWLNASPLQKWVIAFSSARLCDGGAGATYVLLRRRPATKRIRKRKA